MIFLRKIVFLVLLTICTIFSNAQTIDWHTRADITHVFEISDREAVRLLRKQPSDKALIKLLHTQVGQLSSFEQNKPECGHFIFAEMSQDRVNYSYVPIIPFQVFIFRQYGTLTVQVVDANGEVRGDARVRLNRLRINFDNESRTYSVENRSELRDHLMTVQLDGFTAVFDVTKHLVNPWYNFGNNANRPNFYSYMITDKNKYKPGETVRFKSYALSGNKRPLRGELSVWTTPEADMRFKQVGTVQAHHPGGFAGEFVLHDTLKMRLDRRYPLQLRDARGRIVASTNFLYQDYELYDNKLEVKVGTFSHYYPQTNSIEITATDANGLFLHGMKADITIKRRNVTNVYTELLLLPDTLLHQSIDLDDNAPTFFEIPHEIFGEADLTYEVEVVALTFDNQRMIQQRVITFYRSHHNIVYQTHGDSISFEYYELGVNRAVAAELSYNDSDDLQIIELPHKEKFDQTVNAYNFRVLQPEFKRSISTSAINTGFDLVGGFQADSFNVKLINPLQLEVSWYIYQGNSLLDRGSGTDFDFKSAEADWTTTYYVEIFYFMGEREQAFRRVFTPQADFLSVNVDLPQRIYPGQTVDATIHVTNNLGRAAPNVDLTAFAFNSLLNYNVPDLPYYGTPPNTREQRASYSMKKRQYIHSAKLDFDYWNEKVELQRHTYYQFAYPVETMFTYVVDTPDASTQFAPFVTKDGRLLTIYVIEIDDKPVHFSWTQQPEAFSFHCPADKLCKVSLRLFDKVIILHNIRFERGKKTIISLDTDNLPQIKRPTTDDPIFHVTTINMSRSNRFTETEMSRYRSLIARFPTPSYTLSNVKNLTVERRRFLIYHPCLTQRTGSVLAGPISQGMGSYDGSVLYRHEGGFSYSFERNVVYKLNTELFPQQLSGNTHLNLSNINDFVLNYDELNNNTFCREWPPQQAIYARNNLRLNFKFPTDADLSGLAALLFRDNKTGRLFFIDYYEYYHSPRFYSLFHGLGDIATTLLDAILLYNNGNYIRMDSVPIVSNTWLMADMRQSKLIQADSLSQNWLSQYNEFVSQSTTSRAIAVPQAFLTRSLSNNFQAVTGVVSDSSDGSRLPGATIRIKDTNIGATTDIDGNFSINIDGEQAVLIFSFVGFQSMELQVTPGSNVEVMMAEEVSSLEEMVVIGYGTQRRTNLTGAVTTIGASSAPPDDVEDDGEDADVDAEETLYQELLQLNGLRRNFSDVAFWEPRLFTDRNGMAQFSVTFPDNITRWDAVVYAMNRQLKTGTARHSIRSFKPIMAELSTPRFLVEGDTSYFSGTVRNYSHDAQIEGSINFAIDGDTLISERVELAGIHADKLRVIAASTDSITALYTFTRSDGYMDGEERTIPVVPQGVMMAEGTMGFLLNNGDEAHFEAGDNEQLNIIISGNQLTFYNDVTRFLTTYRYDCNEQLASKLIGLLGYRLYLLSIGDRFRHDRSVNDIIRRLLENRNVHRLWSWWGRSPNTSEWMSAHILTALHMAVEAGYNADIEHEPDVATYAEIAPYRTVWLHDLDVYHARVRMGEYPRCRESVELFEKKVRVAEEIEMQRARASRNSLYPYQPLSYLTEKLQLWEICQLQDIDYVTDSFFKYLRETAIGAVNCSDGFRPRNWRTNTLANTMIAYRIAQRDSALHKFIAPMQLYILGTRSYGWNTWQASSAVATVMPDLLGAEGGISNSGIAGVKISGAIDRHVSEFPYEAQLQPGERVSIVKESGISLIYSAYSYRRVTTANLGDVFEVSTSISGGDILKAGIPVTLRVKVVVKRDDAEYVMIEAPIPASCSYATQPSPQFRFGNEVHREHFKEKTVIFCERLPIGTHYFNIELLPRYTGRYTLNPAKIELMYLPVVNANNEMREVEVN